MQTCERQLIIGGRPWNIFEAGSGTPLVFLHNGGGTLWNWAHQLQHFSFEYKVIAPDLPGFGRSYRTLEPLTLHSYVEGLAELLQVLNCAAPILVGNCIGASIALEFALRQQEKVKALVLFNICGGLPMLSTGLRFWASLHPSTAAGKRLHQYMLDCASHPMLQSLGADLLYANGEPELHPDLKHFCQQQILDPQLRASLYWLARGLNSFDVFSQRRKKPVHFPPVLLGWGSQNRTLDPGWANFIAEWLHPDHLWMIDKAGHMPMYEQPIQINEKIEQFIRKVLE